jgi:hypothetical protein
MGVTFVLIVLFYEETKFSATYLNGSELEHHQSNENREAKSGFGVKDGKTGNGGNSSSSFASELPPARTLQIHGGERRIDRSIPRKSLLQRLALITNSPGSFSTFFSHVWQPFMLLALFPAVAFTALQYGASVSWIAILGTTQSILYPVPPYNFQPSGVGLLNIPPFIGAILGSIWGGPLSDMYILWRASRHRGIYEPEMRLEMMVLPALATPAGLLCYGLTTGLQYHWIFPCIGSAILGFGITAISDIVLTFLVDSYVEILGDALIGVAFVRNGLSTALVFGISPWMANTGVYNMFVVAGCVSLAVTMLCIPMRVWGKTIRAKTRERYAVSADKQYGNRGI